RRRDEGEERGVEVPAREREDDLHVEERDATLLEAGREAREDLAGEVADDRGVVARFGEARREGGPDRRARGGGREHVAQPVMRGETPGQDRRPRRKR